VTDDGRRPFAACVVYHGSGPVATRLAAMPDRRARWQAVDGLVDRAGELDHPAVFLVDETLVDHFAALRDLPRHVVLVAADRPAEDALGRRAHVSLGGIDDEVARRRLLRAACQLSCARLRGSRRRQSITQREHELRDLTKVGIALMAEHNRRALLDKIVDVGKELTASDAGVLVLAEPDRGGPQRLRLVLYKCDSVPDLSSLSERTFQIDDSTIIGHAAATRQLLVIKDAYDLPAGASFGSDRSVDAQVGYHRRSMLIVPMVDHLDVLVGILMFVNRKRERSAVIRTKEDADRFALPYTDREVRLAHALASQAAVSIENAELYARVEGLLDSFVKASVTAIDQHDPTTAGHSVRVAALTMRIAEEVDRAEHGPFSSVRFSADEMRELYFAALLHDFGKITVRDDVLMKAKKLPPVLWERINGRLDLIRFSIGLDYQRRRSRVRAANGSRRAVMARLDRAMAADLARLDEFRQLVRAANEPAVLANPPSAALFEMATRTYERPDGTRAPYLTQDELHYLRVVQGTLDGRERAQVEAHAEETYRFLVDIPWTDELRHLATFAHAHHEKLDGTGYPRRLHATEIPIQTRILTIADVFDALTESDRPYKPAVSADVAIEILKAEAAAGLLDRDLVDLVVETRAYRKILDEDWRSF
jgi:HD-GYP domain-containing protein (c-di-GMP phosphodiesterase class II)